MNDQDLLAEIQKLAEVETTERKALAHGLAHLQSQIMILVRILESKSVLTRDVVRTWAQESDLASNIMMEMAAADLAVKQAQNEEEIYDTMKKFLTLSKDLAVLTGQVGDGGKFHRQLQELESTWLQSRAQNADRQGV